MANKKSSVEKTSFDHTLDRIFRRSLHIFEQVIAAVTIIALILAMAREIGSLFSCSGSFDDLSTFLHHVLTIVVGLEFVRMIIDCSPASILEVLSVAITRYVILNHEDPWSNLACIICIASLFAVRRFLVNRSELNEEE